MRHTITPSKTSAWVGMYLYLFLAIFCPNVSAQQIILDFNDGLLPSAHGWTFQGQDDASVPNPIAESQVASVSGGILFLDTATPFGVGSDNAFAIWTILLPPIDAANYVMEIRMRAFLPDALRSFCSGLLGAALEVKGNFVTEVSLMPRQLSVTGLPGATCSTQINLPADGGNFHTYKVEVQNNNQATIFVDGSPVATGTLIIQPSEHQILFGDLSTSGGNVQAEIDFIRVASLIKTVAIDIKPGSDPNAINPNSKGDIPVAILTTSTAAGEPLDFDATTVDPQSVEFGPNGATESHGKGHIEDADGDGDLDMVLHFKTQETGIQCGDTEASLSGETTDGQDITGSDAIQTVGCSSPKKIAELEIETSVPQEFGLFQNYPNPFNPETEIRFALPQASHVVLRIYNTLGQEIRTLGDRDYAGGLHSLSWDGKDAFGKDVASGIYLYKIEAGEFVQVRKMSLLR